MSKAKFFELDGEKYEITPRWTGRQEVAWLKYLVAYRDEAIESFELPYLLVSFFVAPEGEVFDKDLREDVQAKLLDLDYEVFTDLYDRADRVFLSSGKRYKSSIRTFFEETNRVMKKVSEANAVEVKAETTPAGS